MYYVNIIRNIGGKAAAAAAVLMIAALFSAVDTSAQSTVRKTEATYMSPSIGIVGGQTIRVGHFAMGDGSVRAVGGHVKVFDGAGVAVMDIPIREVQLGESDHIDIRRRDLSHVGDPLTGRLQIRLEILVVYADSRRKTGDSTGVFPPSFELVSDETGQSILIGLLLPAIQK